MVSERDSFLGCFGILHYGDIEVTKQCINSLLKINRIQDCLIMVLDNDSRDNAKEKFLDIYKSIPNIRVLKTEGQYGFSKANNYLYKQCISYDLLFVALLNNDIEIHQKEFIDNLMDVIQLNKYYIIGPDVYKPSTREHQSPLALYYPGVESINKNVLCSYREMLQNDDVVKKYIRQKNIIELAHKYLPDFLFTLYRSFSRMDAVPLNYKKSYENCIISGACIIFTNKFIKRENKAFDPETEFYFEEMIIGLRCKIKGYKTLYTPSLKVYHKHAVSSLKEAKSQIAYEKIVANRMISSFEVLKKCEETNYFKSGENK